MCEYFIINIVIQTSFRRITEHSILLETSFITSFEDIEKGFPFGKPF